MIVSVLRERELAPRVRLYELEDRQAPLRELRDQSGLAIEALDLPNWGVLPGRDAEEDLWGRAISPQPLRLRLPEGEVETEGLLAIDDWWTALTFLRDHWQVGAHPAIDAAVEAWRAGDAQAPMRLEHEIQQTQRRARDDRFGRRRRGRRRPRIVQGVIAPILIGEEARGLDWSTLDGSPYLVGSGQIVVPTHQQTRPVLAAEIDVAIGGRAIPRWQLLVATEDWQRPAHEHAVSYWLFDGRRGRFLQRLEEAELEAPAHLLRHGRLQAAFPLDVMPQTHLVPRALVRVPSQDEVEALGGDADGPAPHPLLGRPAIVRDSRSPIELPDALPILDDPAIGRWLIARTRDGIMLPVDDARSVARLEPGEESGWAVVCEPRR